ncbi:hypothetical protein NF675_08740 [Pseudomonas siliginis]|uniref:hypothetical protein n=1 Tax=Pseudomonas siliginis TaxID=2842346 RepID=UPI00105A2BBB|nr:MULTISPECIES: hypothetical protein [Pseudomonas]TDK51991.1 hypothetical protein E1508_23880 [Pseudomonas moraviensis]UST76157.1 hypothetical protein NF675_08740 [Pseudomonas siliginis]
MIRMEIKILTPKGIETATIECDRKNKTLTFMAKDGYKKTYTSYDLYGCFGVLRSEFPDIIFLCKGSKINVHPSSMSSQMSCGLVAYELHEGRSSGEGDIVRIFDYEDTNLTNNIEDQKAFYRAWMESF